MPIDTNLIPALEQELIFARQVSPGGQEPDPARIAAIEDEIARYRAAEAEQGAPVESVPENLSDVSENYETSDDAAERREEDVATRKAKKATEQAAPVETADASTPLETADA